jgi:hypothetical protein
MRNQSNPSQEAQEGQHAEVIKLATEALAEYERRQDGGHGSLLLIADALARSVRLLLPLVPASEPASTDLPVRDGGAS